MVLMPFPALVLSFFIIAGKSLGFIINVKQSQINATVGGNAIFSVSPSVKISSGSWTFKEKMVCQWIGQEVSIDNSYTSRAELFTSNGSLLLKSVNKSDSGEYLVNMVPVSGSQASAIVTLHVTESSVGLAHRPLASFVIGFIAGVVLMTHALIF